jgi:hypothetical protein
MGVQGKLEYVGKAALLRAANAPILTGGQLVIAGMKLTTGLGEPEDGARFGRGGSRLHLSQAVEDQDPPAPLPPPPPEPSPEEKPERPPEDESKDQPAEGEPPTPPPTRASGSPAQFVASPSPTPPAAVAQVPASPARSATGAPPAGGMPPAAVSAGAAPMAPAPGIPIGLIKEAVLAALKQDADRQAPEDEKDKEDADDEDEKDEDGDGKPDEAKDDEAASPGEGDTSRLTTPIAVTVDPENPIGPPPAPRP